MASLPFGATADDTGEFFLGSVAVTPVLLESNGTVDSNTENWNATHKSQVLANLNTGLNWWTSLLATKTSVHSLSFQVDTTYVDAPSPTVYEPINRVSNDYVLWVSEFLNRTGFNQSNDLEANIRKFNDAQRTKHNTDWAFTVFIVNSQVEGDGTFAAGGSFTRAFAFAGGLFYVVPSTRPASTYAHETGHMFWARDEYSGGGNYLQRRGYYNTQNLNASDLNPTTNFQQANSIMSAGVVLQNAYDQLVSPASTLAMVGWQDSDSDGVFDVLDVPLVLDGVGRFDDVNSVYRFKGSAKTKALANLNSSGLQNDITLNQISRIEYRIDNGSWTTLVSPNKYEVDLDFSIPVSPGGNTIQIRAIDAETSITSNLFQGNFGPQIDSTSTQGITGFVWSDRDSDGNWDANEEARTGITVKLVDANGQELALQKTIEPDNLGLGELPNSVFSGATLTAVGLDTDGSVGVFVDTRAVTGSKVLRPFSLASQDFVSAWRGTRQQLRVDFQSTTSYVAVDVAAAEVGSYARLEAYTANGTLLDRVTSAPLNLGQSTKLVLTRATADIAYVMVKGHNNTSIVIDAIQHGTPTNTRTDAFGRYAFTGVVPGTYRVQVVAPTAGYTSTSPASGVQSTTVVQAQASTHVDFGMHYAGSPWHNEVLAQDTNQDGQVTPLDALLVINRLNLTGSQVLDGSNIPTNPFIDVSNDRSVTPLDALLVINYLNLNGIGGEGNEGDQSGTGFTGSGSSETGSQGSQGSAEGESEISAVWDRYGDEVGPLMASNEFHERLTMPRWKEPIPCHCPYCMALDDLG